jgi:hypothetical protein
MIELPRCPPVQRWCPARRLARRRSGRPALPDRVPRRHSAFPWPQPRGLPQGLGLLACVGRRCGYAGKNGYGCHGNVRDQVHKELLNWAFVFVAHRDLPSVAPWLGLPNERPGVRRRVLMVRRLYVRIKRRQSVQMKLTDVVPFQIRPRPMNFLPSSGAPQVSSTPMRDPPGRPRRRRDCPVISLCPPPNLMRRRAGRLRPTEPAPALEGALRRDRS